MLEGHIFKINWPFSENVHLDLRASERSEQTVTFAITKITSYYVFKLIKFNKILVKQLHYLLFKYKQKVKIENFTKKSNDIYEVHEDWVGSQCPKEISSNEINKPPLQSLRFDGRLLLLKGRQ